MNHLNTLFALPCHEYGSTHGLDGLAHMPRPARYQNAAAMETLVHRTFHDDSFGIHKATLRAVSGLFFHRASPGVGVNFFEESYSGCKPG